MGLFGGIYEKILEILMVQPIGHIQLKLKKLTWFDSEPILKVKVNVFTTTVSLSVAPWLSLTKSSNWYSPAVRLEIFRH